jgi:hypothetical protein
MYEGDALDYAINIYNPTGAPPCAFNPNPVNNQINVNTNNLLAWESTDATNFDVYFGTEETPSFIQNQVENSYNPDLLEINTTYYWKIIAKNEYGEAIDCETWTFTTGEEAGYCIPGYSDCYEWGDEIDDFFMEDLIHENSGCSDTGFGDFTASGFTTNLVQAADISWEADYGVQDALAIWIDFNDDGIFNATNEFVYHTELEGFSNITPKIDCQIELELYTLEAGNKCANDLGGDFGEDYFIYFEELFEQTLNKYRKIKVSQKITEKIETILETAFDGYGHKDTLEDLWAEFSN